MKDNRRKFIKKTAALAAGVSVGSIASGLQVQANEKMITNPAREYRKDAGMKFCFLMNSRSPRVPFAREMGVLHAVSGVNRAQGLRPWDPEAISATKAAWDKLGIKWCVVEGPPALGSQTRLGLEGRDEEISNFITLMKNLKKYGDVDIICYNWMPVISWARTNMETPGRGGALMTAFDYEDSKGKPLTEYGEVSKATLWQTLEYFLKAVVPEAEKAGVFLSMHPDDPQVDSIQGISRIMTSVESFERMLAIYPSRYSGITMCQGNFSLMGADIPSLVRRWGKDVISFVHFRNIQDLSGNIPSTKFVETFHDEGQIDMYEAMKAYYDIGFEGPLRPDHVPVMSTEIENPDMRGGYTTLGTLYATGYIRGLAESVAKQGSKI